MSSLGLNLAPSTNSPNPLPLEPGLKGCNHWYWLSNTKNKPGEDSNLSWSLGFQSTGILMPSNFCAFDSWYTLHYDSKVWRITAHISICLYTLLPFISISFFQTSVYNCLQPYFIYQCSNTAILTILFCQTNSRYKFFNLINFLHHHHL